MHKGGLPKNIKILIDLFLKLMRIIGPLRTNFSNLDIFAVDDIWNVHILVRRNVIRGVKAKKEV